MTPETRTFIRTYLNIETADGDLKGILNGFRDEWVGKVKDGLLELITSRELDVHGYEALTNFEFASDDDLYAYLRTVWDYIFTDSTVRPWLPNY